MLNNQSLGIDVLKISPDTADGDRNYLVPGKLFTHRIAVTAHAVVFDYIIMSNPINVYTTPSMPSIMGYDCCTNQKCVMAKDTSLY